MQRKKVVNKCIFIGTLLILISFFILILKNIGMNRKYINEQKLINDFFEETNDENYVTNDGNNNITDGETVDDNNSLDEREDNIDEEYIAIIEIPKISLKKGLFAKDSVNNDVNKNIKILSSSTMPSEDGSNLMLASHAGSSNASYFKNLYKMEIDDYIYLFYNRKRYSYKVSKIFEIEKDGNIDINKNSNNKLLILITCKLGTKKQIVVVTKLVSEEEF